MDGFSIRPVMREMAQRLADGGYLVLLPDLYYRIGSYLPMDPPRIVADPKLREEFMKLVTSLNRDQKVSDAGAFIEFLLSRSDVRGDRFAATGYCMGGNVSLTAAGAFPGRFAAVPDHPMFDPASAERHWTVLFKLFQKSFAPET